MSDIGIPISQVTPNGIFCAGCGETGRHAETCPSLRMSRIRIPQAYVETDALHEEIADLRARVAALEDRLHRVVGYSSQQDRNTAECVGALESRLSALEAKRKK